MIPAAGKAGREGRMRASDLNIDRIYINKITREADYKMSVNHFHYYYEIFYVEQGSCRFFIGGSLFDLKRGDFLVIPPREVHYNRYLTQCTRINLYFRREDLETAPASYTGPEGALSVPLLVHFPGSCRSVIEELFSAMLREDKVDDPISGRVLRLQLGQFFLYADRYGTRRRVSSPISSDADQTILHITEYIGAHYGEPLTLGSLARIAGLSPSYFSRRFKIVTGMRTMEYINYIRLTKASQELLSTDHTITEVAMHSGFSDSNYFKDSFRRTYGLSPRAYRKNRFTDSHILEISRAGEKASGKADLPTSPLPPQDVK